MNVASLSPAGLWRRHPREIVALGALALSGIAAVGGSALSAPNLDAIAAARTEQTPPAPPPLLVRNVAPGDAEALNRTIPVAGGPNPAAQPFSTAKLDSATRARALDCLASAVYYEAGTQSDDGERAVAQVVLNRVRHPAFPSTVCGVVFQGSTRSTGCQFTFTCDGSLERRPDSGGWARARRIAQEALNGTVFGPVGLATHYHANYVVPYWASTLAKNAVVGAHLFYRWAGSWGKSAAFSQAYARQEPSSAALKSAALAAFENRLATAVTEEEQLAGVAGAEAQAAPAGRVAVRFKVAEARKAVEAAPHEAYVEKLAASDNLKWMLSGVSSASTQAPLGSARAEAEATPTD